MLLSVKMLDYCLKETFPNSIKCNQLWSDKPLSHF